MTEASPHPDLSLFLPIEELEKEGEIISIYVNCNHPLLQLKRALPWEAIHEVMVRRWRAGGQKRRWSAWAILGCLVVCACYCANVCEALQ